jgi:hypothetical protein
VVSPEDSPQDPPLEFTRRPHREGDHVALLKLLDAAFERWPACEITVDRIDHLRWKLSSPGASRLHRITEVDGRIASSTFCIVQEVKVRDRVLHGIQGVDSCVHPDYQRRGLVEAIIRYRAANVDEQPCDIQFGVRSPHPAFQRIRGRAPDPVWPIANRLQALSMAGPGPGPPRGSAGCAIRVVERFDHHIDGFFEEAARPFDFIIARTKDYLNWRYADPRAGRFAIRVAEQGDELLGYAVGRVSHGKGYIADLLALPDRLDVVEALVNDAARYLWDAGVSRVDCWLPAVHPYRDVLERAGFAFRRFPTNLDVIQRTKDIDLSFLEDPAAAVHVCAGDTDLV